LDLLHPFSAKHIIIRPGSNGELGAGKYDEQPWYFTTGQQDFKVNGFEPSNEYSTQEGKPYTGVFSFTSKNERWLSHFSGEKLTFYKFKSGDAVVTIEGTKVK